MSLNAQERTISKIGSTNALSESKTLYTYTAVSADTLTATNQDTIDLVLEYRGNKKIKKIAVKSRFDIIAGADTTVAITVSGKDFADATTYTDVITSTLSGAVTANNTVKIVSTTAGQTNTVAAYNVAKDAFNLTVSTHVLLTDTAGLMGYPADSISVPSYTIAIPADTLEFPEQSITIADTDITYRFYRVRYIIQGDDSVGTGIKIDEVEFKIYTE